MFKQLFYGFCIMMLVVSCTKENDADLGARTEIISLADVPVDLLQDLLADESFPETQVSFGGEGIIIVNMNSETGLFSDDELELQFKQDFDGIDADGEEEAEDPPKSWVRTDLQEAISEAQEIELLSVNCAFAFSIDGQDPI